MIQPGFMDRDDPTPDELEIAYAKCHEQYLSCMLLRGSNYGRYKILKDDLCNNMSLGVDNFPKTIVETTRLMNYKVPRKAQRVKENQAEGVAFIQDRKAPNLKDIECWHCSKKGHYKTDCPQLQINGMENRVQNLFAVEEYNDGMGLFSAEAGVDRCDDLECHLVQKGWKCRCTGILNLNHLYIDTCAMYASTPHAIG